MEAKRDLHQEITDKIIAAIEAGAGKWEMPWQTTGNGMPTNAITKKRYNGVNIISLLITGMAMKYPTQEWASFKQWQGAGANVRKGEKGTEIVYYTLLVRKVDGEEKKIPLLKYSYVFNAGQVDGYNAKLPELPALAERISLAEEFVAKSGAEVRFNMGHAYYSPAADFIAMPAWEAFKDTKTATATENAYSTELHELIHWTGNAKRCARDLTGRFGNNAYAAEELVADLGAAFLCGELGIAVEPRPDHAKYLSSWLVVLRADKKAIFTAASKASAAVAYLHQLHDGKEDADSASSESELDLVAA
jgi:antirestriction protein ArdC